MPLASAQHNPLSSAHALMSGMPAFVDGTAHFLDQMAHMIAEATQRAVAAAQHELRMTASHTDGWRDVAKFLTVEFDGEHIKYGISNPAMLPKVLELEFGNLTDSPTGLLRKTAIAQAHLIGARVSSVLDREVPIA